MRLKNKKTGEIGYLIVGRGSDYYTVTNNDWENCGKYKTIAELNDEWEDMSEEEWQECWAIDIVDDRCISNLEEGFGPDDIERAKELGLYFETEEEAEKAVEKLKAWKRLKDKGFRFEGWDMRNSDGGYEPSIGFELNGVTEVLEKYEIAPEITQDLDICFGGEDE